MNDAEHKDYLKRLTAIEVSAECNNVINYVNRIAHWMKECVGYIADDNEYYEDNKLRSGALDQLLMEINSTREDLYSRENLSAFVIAELFHKGWKDEHKAHHWLMFYCLTSPYRSSFS